MKTAALFPFICALAVCNLPFIQALYSKTSKVLNLTDYNFKDVSSDSKVNGHFNSYDHTPSIHTWWSFFRHNVGIVTN
jgi:hypothetical protein